MLSIFKVMSGIGLSWSAWLKTPSWRPCGLRRPLTVVWLSASALTNCLREKEWTKCCTMSHLTTHSLKTKIPLLNIWQSITISFKYWGHMKWSWCQSCLRCPHISPCLFSERFCGLSWWKQPGKDLPTKISSSSSTSWEQCGPFQSQDRPPSGRPSVQRNDTNTGKFVVYKNMNTVCRCLIMTGLCFWKCST